MLNERLNVRLPFVLGRMPDFLFGLCSLFPDRVRVLVLHVGIARGSRTATKRLEIYFT